MALNTSISSIQCTSLTTISTHCHYFHFLVKKRFLKVLPALGLSSLSQTHSYFGRFLPWMWRVGCCEMNKLKWNFTFASRFDSGQSPDLVTIFVLLYTIINFCKYAWTHFLLNKYINLEQVSKTLGSQGSAKPKIYFV